MVRGTIRWQVPLGAFNLAAPEWAARHVSLGGPMVTAGDLSLSRVRFLDPHLRAFDIESGRELWSAELPAPGHATPMTYEFKGNSM